MSGVHYVEPKSDTFGRYRTGDESRIIKGMSHNGVLRQLDRVRIATKRMVGMSLKIHYFAKDLLEQGRAVLATLRTPADPRPGRRSLDDYDRRRNYGYCRWQEGGA